MYPDSRHSSHDSGGELPTGGARTSTGAAEGLELTGQLTEMTGHLSGGCLNPAHRVLRELGTHHTPQPEGQERGGQALLSRTNSHSASNSRQPLGGGGRHEVGGA